MPAVEGRSFENIEYARIGGQPLLMNGFVPDLPAPGLAAILVHGGGWVGGDRIRNLEPLFALLKENGIACFSISYRLVLTRSAKDFTKIGAGVEDIRTAISFVRKHADEYHVDAGRILLIGESAGAHLAALAALNEPMPSVRAVVGFYMPADLEEIARSSRYLDGYAGALMASPLAALLMPKPLGSCRRCARFGQVRECLRFC